MWGLLTLVPIKWFVLRLFIAPVRLLWSCAKTTFNLRAKNAVASMMVCHKDKLTRQNRQTHVISCRKCRLCVLFPARPSPHPIFDCVCSIQGVQRAYTPQSMYVQAGQCKIHLRVLNLSSKQLLKM